MDYKANPFYLNNAQIAWVEETLSKMSLRQKAGQLFFPIGSDNFEEMSAMLAGLQPCGLMFRTSPMETVAEAHQAWQELSEIPLILAANLEAGGNGLVSEGTSMGNNMTVAATDDADLAYKMGVISAREARAVGGNLAFAPVVDINFNCNNPIANIRSFGDQPDKVLEMGLAYMKGVQENGCGVTIKHFPGDGVDDRDQHVVTSNNSLSVAEWDASFGKVYGELVKAGALGLMVGHIRLPAYSRLLRPGIKNEELMPATLAPELLNDLLREKLGFNGLILTDATLMSGFNAMGERKDLVPATIAAGCDVFLFSRDWQEDLQFMLDGIENGVLTLERLDEAVARILAFKAALNLPEQKANGTLVPKDYDVVGNRDHHQWAAECADKSVTLAKDTQGLLPLSVEKHKKILFLPFGDSTYFGAAQKVSPQEKFAQLLEVEGFELTTWDFAKDPALNFSATRLSIEKMRADFDLVLYFVDIPTASNKTTLRLSYNSFVGFDAPWLVKDLPTMMVSTANPYHLYDAPQIKTLVNAYNSRDVQLQAVVDKLLGRSAFKGVSPVDQFCGRWDAKL
ncbi:MAG: glycoside hydrolase family 3 protein [Anaerolineales bacterium]|nr:glycoside hydrolase family 3 protein [Anaerolineales bacterium]